MEKFCAYFDQKICKSCSLLKLNYNDQIDHKMQKLRHYFKNDPILPPVVSPQKHFRNKVKLAVTGTLDHPVLGIWGKGDPSDLATLDQGVEILNCPVHVEKINQMLPIIIEFIKKAKLIPYQISNKKGELKGIIIFYSQSTKESYLRLVLRSKESIDRIRKYQNDLYQHIFHLQVLTCNIQPIAHALLEGEEEIFISKNKTLRHQLGSLNMSVGPRGFIQTNQFVAQKLYQTAASWIKESSQKHLVELFCGQGAFSLAAHSSITQAWGIEINKEAISIAQLSAKLNGIHHITFSALDAENLSLNLKSTQDKIFLVNPPRRGLGKSIDFLVHNLPPVIIYSSCHVKSLSQDLETLKKWYHLSKIQLFDMFPHTEHFETLVELKLKENVDSN